MANAFDDLDQTSPEIQAIKPSGKNAFDDLEPPTPKEATPPPNPGTLGQQVARGAGLSVRALAQGAASLPMMIPDAATVVGNYIKNPHVPTWAEINPFSAQAWPSNTPSQQFDRALDPYLPTPQTKGEKIASALLAMEGGALTPQVPVPKSTVPSNFQNATQTKRALDAKTLENSQKAGYVVPPSTTNPTIPNVALETVAGKINMQNAASALNQRTRNAAAAKDLGLNPDLLTPEAVAAVKAEAGKGFEAARSIPRFSADTQYGADLDKVMSSNRGANADFPGASNPDVEKIVETYRVPSFTGDSAVSAIKLLREKANDAYRQGRSELGAAYKGVAGAIERQTERGAESLEKPPDPRQFSLDMGFANQGDISARKVFEHVTPPDPQQFSLNMGFAEQGDVGSRRLVEQLVRPAKPKLPMEWDAATGRYIESGIRPTRAKVVQQSGPPQQAGIFGERALESFEPAAPGVVSRTIQELGPSQQGGLPIYLRAPETLGPQPVAAPAGKYSSLIEALRAARKRYAQASTVEDAMDPSGNISGQKLAAAWNRDEPLSDNLLIAARHAAAFPKANGPVNASNVQHLNMLGPVAGAMAGHELTHSPWGYLGGAAVPASRMASRAYLLSKMGQKGAIPPSELERAFPAWTFGALTGAANP